MTKEEKKEKIKKLNEMLIVSYTYGIDDEIHRFECELEYLLREKTE